MNDDVVTIAQPEPLLGQNGRTLIVPRGPAPDDAGDAAIVAAPGYLLFIGGKYNGHDQWFSIDPGPAFNRVIAAMEKGRRIAAGDDYAMPTSDRTVIAALRLALVEGWAKPDDAIAVARAILDTAEETDPADKAGVAHMVQMIREHRLRAELVS